MPTVLLTGVGRPGQVGETVARTFAASGASVLLVDRTLEHVQARADSLVAEGFQATAYACDLGNAVDVNALAARIGTEHGGRIDALVLMAGGFAMTGNIETSGPEDWDRQFTINLRTAYLTARGFLPMVRATRGAIVFFASAAALPGAKTAGMAAYAAAKTAVVALMQSLAQQERDSGVRANAIAPTAIRTAANLDTMGEKVKYVEREEVAAVVAFLCSENAQAISGQLIRLE